MNEEVDKEYVLHVAELGRLYLNSDEIEKYRNQLKSILDEINKIDELDLVDDTIMVSPSNNVNVFSNNVEQNIDSMSFISNAPKSNGNYIEVRWNENE
ncbi:MAG: Asp-tRNA(Asn)/Glu-tRNA(Gln) amidotransferase subunit GatC [Clostridia bacterium]|jgi:aspartyl/glutamyl-tRNA(Asn/Gln) amidotransferase C subunit